MFEDVKSQITLSFLSLTVVDVKWIPLSGFFFSGTSFSVDAAQHKLWKLKPGFESWFSPLPWATLAK